MQSKRPGFANIIVGGVGVSFTTNEVANVQNLPVLEQQLRNRDQATIDQINDLEVDFNSKISGIEYSVEELSKNTLPQLEADFNSKVQTLSNRLDAFDAQVELIKKHWKHHHRRHIFIDWVLPYINRSFESGTGLLIRKAQIEDPDVALKMTAKQMRSKIQAANTKEKVIPKEFEPDEQSCKEIQAVLKDASSSRPSSK